MEVLQLFRGDSVIVRYVFTIAFAIGKGVDLVLRDKVARSEGIQARDTSSDSEYMRLIPLIVLIVMSDENVEEGKILLNKGPYWLTRPVARPDWFCSTSQLHEIISV